MLRAALLLAAAVASASAWSNRGAAVRLFEWSWADVATECEQWLGPKGFNAALVSPPQEHMAGEPWWTRYQPVTYQLVSRSGDEAAFVDMVKRCGAVGVDILVDAVINHMAAGAGVGTAGTKYYGNRTFVDYAQDDLHHYDGDKAHNCEITNYNDKYNVQYCDLVGLPDLCTSCQHTQDVLVGYLTRLASLGVAGIRIDAAKHQDANELKAITTRLPKDFSIFQEVIGSAGEPITVDMYFDVGQVTEFNYATVVDDNVIPEYKMQYFNTLGESWGLMPDQYAVMFLDNHDTQRNGAAQLTYKNGDMYQFASIFMLAHPYGYPVLMSSFYFTDYDQGPPAVPVHDGSTVHCKDGQSWVCEHRWLPIANMVAWRNAAGTTEMTNWQVGNGNQIAFGRGSNAFIAMNRGSSTWCAALKTSIPSGSYCNVIQSTDRASCPTVTVSEGAIDICVPPLGAIAIHVN